MPPYDFSEMYGSQEGFDPYLQIPSSGDDFTVIGAGGGVMNPNTGEWRGGPNDTRNRPRPQILDGGWGNGNPPQGRGNDFWNSQGGTDYRQRVQEQRQQELESMQQDQPQLPPAGGGEDYRQQERELLQQQEQQFPQGRMGWGSEGAGGFDGRAEERARQGNPFRQQQPGWNGGPGNWQNGGNGGNGGINPYTGPADQWQNRGGGGFDYQGGPTAPGWNRGPIAPVRSPWGGGGGYDPLQFGPGNYAGGGGGGGQRTMQYTSQDHERARQWNLQNGNMTDEEFQQQFGSTRDEARQQGGPQPGGGQWSNNNVANVMSPEQAQQAIDNNRTAQSWYDAEARGEKPPPMFGGRSIEEVARPQSTTIGGGTLMQPHVMPGQYGGFSGGLQQMKKQGSASPMGGAIRALGVPGVGGLVRGIAGMFGGGGNKSGMSPVQNAMSRIGNYKPPVGGASSQGGPWSSMMRGAASVGPAVMKKPQGLQPGPSAQPPAQY